MANNRNKIVGSETDHVIQADYFLSNFPHATDQMEQNLSTFNRSENQKRFHKILDDLMHTTVQMMKNKQIDLIIKDLNISTSCKPEEMIPTCISSSSSIENNAMERDTKIVNRIKQRTIGTIISTTRFGEDFDKARHENPLSIVKDFASLRHTDYATKYVDDTIPERGCSSQCTGAGIQSDIMDREFSSETSSDAFMKASEERRRHKDFILDEIVRISDAVTERVHLASEAKSEDSSSHIILMADEKEEEIFEKAKSLMSIICAQEKPSAVTEVVSKVVIQQKTFVDSRVSISSIHIVQESQDPSAYLDTIDESRVAARIQVISSIEEPSKDESAHEVSSLYPEKRDFQDTVTVTVVKSDKREDEIFLRSIIDSVVLTIFQNITVIRTVVKDDRRKEDEEKTNGEEIDISLQPVLDKEVPVVDKIVDTIDTVDSSITDSIEELREISSQIIISPKQEVVSVISSSPILSEDVSAVDKIVEVVDSLIIDSKQELREIKQEPTIIVKDILLELISCEIPKYRCIDACLSLDSSKTSIERNCFIIKREKMPQCKKIRHAKNLVSCTFLSFTSFEATRRSYCEIPAAKMCQDDRSRLPRILQPIRCCGSLIPSNIYLGKPKYYDIRTTSYFNPQIVATREATLSDVLYPSPQDSRAIGCRVSCRTLIDNRNASLKHCNINCCIKRRAIFGNSAHTTYDTRCKIGIKHSYLRLNNNIYNNINNVRMGYYHCNHNCPVWNNNRYYERNRSFHWCRGNLYFRHP